MGAHLIALIRTRAGRFRLEQALTLEQVAERAAAGQAEQTLIPLSDAVCGFPALTVDDSDARRIAHGNAVSAPPGFAPEEPTAPVRLLGLDGRLLAVARYREGLLRPEVVLT
jgi:tRNA pseudouridine55 synthase